MTRLLWVELTRARWRRAVLLLFLAAIAVPVVVGVARVWDTRPPSAEELAAVDALVAEERERPRTQRQLERCLENPDQYLFQPDESADIQQLCEEATLPQRAWFGDFREIELAEERGTGSGLVVVVLVAALMVLAGTTFTGHDWNSGSMSNQLLFEPRRVRVWLAKALTLTASAFVVSLVVFSAFWLALVAVVRSRGTPVPTSELVDCLQHGLRGAAVVALAGLAGYAFTMLFRSTVVTLGVFFAVSVAGGLLIALFGISERWQPHLNLTAVVANGATYWVDVPDECFTNRPPADLRVCDETAELTAGDGSLYLGTALVGVVVPSLLTFRRRDVP